MNDTRHDNGHDTYLVLGIILARGGSRGLVGKHAVPLLGRPVLDYTLDHAAASRRLSRTVLSTDCPSLRALGAVRFVPTVHRPADLATDTASVQAALLHALDAVEARGDFTADAVVLLYGNVPVRPAGVVDRCVELLQSTGCDSVRTFTPVGKWHPAWMSRLDGDRVDPVVPGSIDRRQDLEPLFLHDGACVAMSRASLERGRADPGDPHAMFGVDRRGVRVEPGSAFEVDTRRDLFMAEAALRADGWTSRGVRMAG